MHRGGLIGYGLLIWRVMRARGRRHTEDRLKSGLDWSFLDFVYPYAGLWDTQGFPLVFWVRSSRLSMTSLGDASPFRVMLLGLANDRSERKQYAGSS